MLYLGKARIKHECQETTGLIAWLGLACIIQGNFKLVILFKEKKNFLSGEVRLVSFMEENQNL